MKENICNGLTDIIAQAVEEMKAQAGASFSLESINLAELSRRTGLSRGKLRNMKAHEFKNIALSPTRAVKRPLKLTPYMSIINDYLSNGVGNASLIFERIQAMGYPGGYTIVKDYVRSHRNLLPAKRQLVVPQGSRGRRYATRPGEAFQMDWGFTKVIDYAGSESTVACFAMICHHCGKRYIEFFPNAKQESLFIGMLHAFSQMGIPQHVLTDNMKSVVIRRDSEGHPVWQKDYEAFMRTVGFQTKLCLPRHPYTKGKVERLVRYVKDNFLAGRVFQNITDLNRAALEWCETKDSVYVKAIDTTPKEIHWKSCAKNLEILDMKPELMFYLCPERRISFDGFVNYEGRRFGIPFQYKGSTARIMRQDDMIYIYSSDLQEQLVAHDVTWSKQDRYCQDQYATLEQPEEYPSVPVKTRIAQISEPELNLSFEKFNFDWEDE